MQIKLFNHIIEFSKAVRPWSYISYNIYRGVWDRTVNNRQIVWGKLSLCWGQPHLATVCVCSECSEEIDVKRAGDESLNWCENCQQLEPRTETITAEEQERRFA